MLLPVLVDLNISEATLIRVITYASAASVMNKVFPTSRVCAWWAFKVAEHPTCVLLLLHEWLEHASQSLSGGGVRGIQEWQHSHFHALGVSICRLLCPLQSLLLPFLMLSACIHTPSPNLLFEPLSHIYPQARTSCTFCPFTLVMKHLGNNLICNISSLSLPLLPSPLPSPRPRLFVSLSISVWRIPKCFRSEQSNTRL